MIGPSLQPLTEAFLTNLRNCGFRVMPFAAAPGLDAPDSLELALRFGGGVEIDDGTSVMPVDSTLSIRGDIATGDVRGWSIFKTYGGTDVSAPAIRFRATIALGGDISARFLLNEGRVAYRLIRKLASDAGNHLKGLGLVGHGHEPSEPISCLAAPCVIDLATRGNLPSKAMRLYVATRLRREILPEFALSGFSSATGRSTGPSRKSQRRRHLQGIAQ